MGIYKTLDEFFQDFNPCIVRATEKTARKLCELGVEDPFDCAFDAFMICLARSVRERCPEEYRHYMEVISSLDLDEEKALSYAKSISSRYGIDCLD